MKFHDIFQNFGEIHGGVRWQILTERNLQDPLCLEQYGYKVYSQNDEDGIIQEIFHRIGETNKIFVEFGVQNGLESNCHYLLFHGWKGNWIEGSQDYTEEIQHYFHPVLASGQLKCKSAFITKDNINDLIKDFSLPEEIDLLSIDIDGNDYYVWQEINVIRPRVVVIEYNGKFPPDCDWKMAYNENHIWVGTDWHGASLKALELLGRKLGYQLVGTSILGANAFFVRSDLAVGLFHEPATAEELYNPLRMVRYVSGHNSQCCLANQHENMGILDYCLDDEAVAAHGFYGIEPMGTKQIRWSARCYSQLMVRLPSGATAVHIPYHFSKSALERCDGCYNVKIAVNGSEEIDCHVTSENGVWEIPLKVSDKEACVINISVPFVWDAESPFGTRKLRKQGIAVVVSDICVIN